jgi:hypothetical protein
MCFAALIVGCLLMPYYFGGPPIKDGWARADELLRPAEEYLAREGQRYLPTKPIRST